MEKIALTAQVREKAGKGVARGLRRNQMVPAVLYSHGKSMPISMGNKEVTRILNTEGGEHALINLKLEGTKGAAERIALIKEYQLDPISGALMHVDLMEVAMNEKVKIPVAVHLSGASIGVKEGGILQYGIREVEVECLPHQIPEHIEVNIEALKVNESLHVRDITVAEGIRILTDEDATVATIQPPISDAKLEAMLSAAPATAEAGEPELVKKPKKEGEAAAAAPAPEAKAKEAAPKEAAPKKEVAPKK
ncbi:MAG TPA: 50S ribosomal protein L25 [Nitrospirota bacterium]|nr:50S ribosomal protein L25 [Nitrospirota bacterium]